MNGKRYDVGKIVNGQKVADSFKVTIRGVYATLIVLGDLEINQLYEK